MHGSRAQHPLAKAFAVAQKLAPQAIRDALIIGTLDEEVDAYIGEVFDVLCRERTKAGKDTTSVESRKVLEQFIDSYAPDRTTEVRMSDAITEVTVEVSDAAYLFGLAVGLATARGAAAQ